MMFHGDSTTPTPHPKNLHHYEPLRLTPLSELIIIN